MNFQDPQKTFEQAIESGTLSIEETANNFAGNYMYMGHSDGVAQFKNIVTREYITD